MRNMLLAPVMFLAAAVMPAVAQAAPQDTPPLPWNDAPNGQQESFQSNSDGSVRDDGKVVLRIGLIS